LTAGVTSACGAFLAGFGSRWLPDRFLLILFGSITLLVMIMMMLPAPSEAQENRAADQVTLARLPLAIFSTLTGGVTGLLGSGNFIFPPLLIYVLKVPTRIAIGSSPVIAMINSSAGFLGKLITGQIPLLLAGTVVIGAALGALGGERVHRRLSSTVLRRLYAIMVSAIAIKVWLSILSH
jgi:uncharacterized membrane protein YfcA